MNIPRYVLSITDTKTTIEGKNGAEYLNVSIASDKLSDFVKTITKDKRTNRGRTEFEAMLWFFADQTAKADKERKTDEIVEYSKVKDEN